MSHYQLLYLSEKGSACAHGLIQICSVPHCHLQRVSIPSIPIFAQLLSIRRSFDRGMFAIPFNSRILALLPSRRTSDSCGRPQWRITFGIRGTGCRMRIADSRSGTGAATSRDWNNVDANTLNILLSGLQLSIERTMLSGRVLFLTSEALPPLFLAPIQPVNLAIACSRDSNIFPERDGGITSGMGRMTLSRLRHRTK
jgi:hypothetical protein